MPALLRLARSLASLLVLAACANGPEASPAPAEAARPSPDTPAPESAAATPVPLDAFATAHNAFAFDLLRELGAGPPKNLAISPFSVATVLAMIHAGARGETATQIARALHLESRASPNLAIGQQLQRWSAAGSGDLELRAAQGLFADRSLRLEDSFVAVMREHYRAESSPHDFQSQPAAAVREINRWAADATEDRIPDLLSPDAITAETRLVLANAVYFKGVWRQPFSTEQTRPRPFVRDDGTKVSVPIMHRMGEVAIAQVDGVTAVRLPYAGDRLAMLLMLPPSGTPLPTFARQLAPDLLARLERGWRETRISLQVPRFTIEPGPSLALEPTLRKLGIELAFGNGADLRGLSATPLFVDEVYHAAFVAVDERGTEAAGATAGTAIPLSAPKVVAFDRPFVFAIIDLETRVLLFVGHVADPSGSP